MADIQAEHRTSVAERRIRVAAGHRILAAERPILAAAHRTLAVERRTSVVRPRISPLLTSPPLISPLPTLPIMRRRILLPMGVRISRRTSRTVILRRTWPVMLRTLVISRLDT